MTDNFEIKIGFDRIRRQIGERCTTHRGRALFESENFSTDMVEIERRQALAEEMRTAQMMDSDAPRGEFTEFTAEVRKISVVGAFLETEEVQHLGDGLRSVGETAAFFGRKEQYPLLRALSAEVGLFPEIVGHIDTMLDRFGRLRDSASPELYSIRKSIRDREGQASKRLQAILSAAISAGYAEPDATLSIRDGRAVIPVSAANKRKVQGFIHDESATGKTFFIEPVEVVGINNELKELEYAERREVVRILTEFTDSLRPEAEAIAQSGEYLAEVDMLRAKARWAIEYNASKPILSLDGRMVLRSARNPILQQALAKEHKEVVPLDMELDHTRRILVISGPNAGGKSVCLKTVGIIQYMFQSGIPVTASSNSELPVFDDIMIDIGDQQSIDNDLSTYSSHLLNMRSMLAEASPQTLILVDEFGSGTEPTIGGAIAEAILERLVEAGTYGVITTHYTNIKYFASSHAGVTNGAMMFDVQNIRPLFRLETGTPGSSFAIEIARKIGLSEQIIANASRKAGTDVINLERQLREVARDRTYWEQKRERIRVADRRVEEMEAEYAERLSKLKEERATLIRQAKADAKELLERSNSTIENTVRVIRESQADKETTRMARRELDSMKDYVEHADDFVSEQAEQVAREMERIERRRQRRAERKAQRGESTAQPEQPQEPERLPVEVGAKVRIVGQEGVGEVVSLKGKKATVAIGQILTTLPIERLEAISAGEYKRQTRPVAPRTVVSVDISSRKLNFRDSIDLRGMRASEALEAVQNFIDDALMVGVGSVSILHGKGTGALKEEVRRYLRTIPDVASAEDDHPDRGGSGITIVTFK